MVTGNGDRWYRHAITIRPSRVMAGILIVVDYNGQVYAFRTPEEIMHWVKQKDARSARLGMNIVSVLDWCDMPEGFVVPK